MKTELSSVYGNYGEDELRILGRFLMENTSKNVDMFKKDFHKLS